MSEIARRTGRDPKTVRKALRQERPRSRPSTWKEGEGRLTPYGDYLRQRVEQGCLNAVVLLEEIAARGYTGKVSILRDFVQPLRQELVRQREATVRLETGPGKQAQVDWGGVRGDLGCGCGALAEAGRVRVHAGLLAGTVAGVHDLKTAILEQVLYDNLKAAILGRRPDGSPVFPGRVLDFALYYGFTPKFCRPYRARTKGKVERGIGYVRGNFWVRVAAEVAAGALDLAGLNERAREWVERVANVRWHGTTEEVVSVRLAEEGPLLGRLDARPRYDTSCQALRRVGRDGRLSYRGQVYQVPLRHALSTVRVSESLDGRVTLRSAEGAVLVGLPVTATGVPADRPRPARAAAEGGLPLLGAGAAPVVEARDLGSTRRSAVQAGLVQERVRAGLERLRVGRMAEVLDAVCEEASRAEVSYLDFLDRLLEAEQAARYERNVAIKTRLARLPYHKTMDDFDYGFQPSIDKKQVAELLTPRFVEHAANVLVLGPSGVGKTHSADYPA